MRWSTTPTHSHRVALSHALCEPYAAAALVSVDGAAGVGDALGRLSLSERERTHACVVALWSKLHLTAIPSLLKEDLRLFSYSTSCAHMMQGIIIPAHGIIMDLA